MPLSIGSNGRVVNQNARLPDIDLGQDSNIVDTTSARAIVNRDTYDSNHITHAIDHDKDKNTELKLVNSNTSCSSPCNTKQDILDVDRLLQELDHKLDTSCLIADCLVSTFSTKGVIKPLLHELSRENVKISKGMIYNAIIELENIIKNIEISICSFRTFTLAEFPKHQLEQKYSEINTIKDQMLEDIKGLSQQDPIMCKVLKNIELITNLISLSGKEAIYSSISEIQKADDDFLARGSKVDTQNSEIMVMRSRQQDNIVNLKMQIDSYDKSHSNKNIKALILSSLPHLKYQAQEINAKIAEKKNDIRRSEIEIGKLHSSLAYLKGIIAKIQKSIDCVNDKILRRHLHTKNYFEESLVEMRHQRRLLCLKLDANIKESKKIEEEINRWIYCMSKDQCVVKKYIHDRKKLTVRIERVEKLKKQYFDEDERIKNINKLNQKLQESTKYLNILEKCIAINDTYICANAEYHSFNKLMSIANMTRDILNVILDIKFYLEKIGDRLAN